MGLYSEGWEERCEKRRKIQAITKIEMQSKAAQSEAVQSEASQNTSGI